MSEFDEMMEKLDAAIKNLGRAVETEEPTISFSRDPWEKPAPIKLKEGSSDG